MTILASRRTCAAGLTLLELLVVVSILAVLATIAVQTTGEIGDQAKFEATQKTFDGFRSSVLGSQTIDTPYGTPVVSGFVADMGRLPRASLATFPDYQAPDLVELHSDQNPGLRPYQMWLTIPSQVSTQWVAGYSSTFAPIDIGVTLGTANTRVPAGWRGPYLRRPASSATLIDGWGKALVSRPDLGIAPTEIAAWPTRLVCYFTNQPYNSGSGYSAVTGANWDVCGLYCRAGFDGAESSSATFGGEFLTTVLTNEYRVTVGFTVRVATNYVPTIGHTIVVGMFGPNPDMSAVTPPLRLWLQQFGYSAPNIFQYQGVFDQSVATIGPKVFRAVLVRTSGGNVVGRPVLWPVTANSEPVTLSIP